MYVSDGNCGGRRAHLTAQDHQRGRAKTGSRRGVEDDDFPLLISSPLSVADSGTGGVRLRLGQWREERACYCPFSLWRSHGSDRHERVEIGTDRDRDETGTGTGTGTGTMESADGGGGRLAVIPFPVPVPVTGAAVTIPGTALPIVPVAISPSH